MDVSDISTQKASSFAGTRIPQENGLRKRSQGACQPSCERSCKAVCIRRLLCYICRVYSRSARWFPTSTPEVYPTHPNHRTLLLYTRRHALTQNFNKGDPMPKLPTLRLNKEFKTAYYWGKSAGGGLLISYVRKAKRPAGGKYTATRYGITTGKKVGGAVQRNRARRLIRESYRLLTQEGIIQPGLDIVFVARADCVKAKMPQVYRQMRGQLDKLEALKTIRKHVSAHVPSKALSSAPSTQK